MDSNEKKGGAPEQLKKLTPLQLEVTQQCGTEPPFQNEFWNNKREGIYVDIVSGEPLFSSVDKYDSGTGWPSFHQPLQGTTLQEVADESIPNRPRVEVRSGEADSHLGHVFEDGPSETGLRYCINSAALRFIPKEELESAGYGGYLSLFQKNRGFERCPCGRSMTKLGRNHGRNIKRA